MHRTAVVLAFLCLAALLTAASGSYAATVYMSIPDTTAGRGDTIWVPIWTTDLTDSNVFSYQFVMSFDSTFIEIVGVSNDGSVTDVGPWMDPAWHIIEGQDSLRVASAGTAPLAGEGLFVSIGVRVRDMAPSDSSMFMGLHQYILNEGLPEVSPDGGWLFVTSGGVGDVPAEGGSPVTVERLSPTTIRWSLASADTHGASLKIFDAFGRFVTSVGATRSEGGVSFTWNGDDSDGVAVSGGVYFYNLASAGGRWSGKVCILR
jgi:hypothetical protein